MELNQYWDNRADLDMILPTLTELNSEGVVDRADAWPALRSEVLSKLEHNGVHKSVLDDLVKPLDDAVSSGGEFKSIVTEITREYEEARGRQADEERQAALERQAPTPQQAALSEEQKEDPAFSAELPNLEELATQIVTDLGPDIAQLIASDPELAKISDQELIQWIADDVTATIDEIGEYGWERLG
jgi:hypothetical protein